VRPTRRPIDDDETLVNYMPTTTLYSKNSMTITRHSGGELDGRINTVELNDGHVKKTLTMVYSGTSLMGFTTVVENV